MVKAVLFKLKIHIIISEYLVVLALWENLPTLTPGLCYSYLTFLSWKVLILVMLCEKIFLVQDGLSQHISRHPGHGWRDLCRDKSISHSKQCHRHIIHACTYRINACISRDIYPSTWCHTDNSSYTRVHCVTPPGKKSVVSDNTWIDEYSLAPLIYYWYTNQFLCYSLDIIS